jgi:hypothetical protein
MLHYDSQPGAIDLHFNDGTEVPRTGFHFNFGTGNNDLIQTHGTAGTVQGLFFRNSTSGTNSVELQSTTDGIFISGQTDVQIGMPSSTGSYVVPANPFDAIGGAIALAGSAILDVAPMIVTLNLGASNLPQTAPAQQYGFGRYDFDLLDTTSTSYNLDPRNAEPYKCTCPLLSNAVPAPSTLMCSWITADGGFSDTACSGAHRVAYTGAKADGSPRIHFDVTSGEQGDQFCAANTTASLSFTSGDGQDQICVSDMNPLATMSFDLGEGVDLIYMVCPLTTADVTLGDDTDPDLALVLYQKDSTFRPEWSGTTIGGLVTIDPQGLQDRILINSFP